MPFVSLLFFVRAHVNIITSLFGLLLRENAASRKMQDNDDDDDDEQIEQRNATYTLSSADVPKIIGHTHAKNPGH